MQYEEYIIAVKEVLILDIEIVGNRIKERRQELNITLQEIANDLNVNKSTIQRYENGKIKDIKMPIIEAIASCLSVNPLWLLGKAENKFHSIEYERATHLMNLHFNSIVKWTENVHLTENQTIVIRSHFWDLLLRYKKIVETFAHSNVSWEVSEEAFRKLYEDKFSEVEIREKFIKSELERSLLDASNWINAFPNWIARNENNLKDLD